MIHEVDAALRAVIVQGALPGGGVDVAMEAPTSEWAARRTGPAVNVYLYDVHEELARREVGPVSVRDERGATVALRHPPRWYRLSYLVSAWTARAEDEHRLLSAVLGTLIRTEALPREHFGPLLGRAAPAVPVSVALRADRDRPVSELWTALGGRLKPSLDVVVTAPFPVGVDLGVGPPATGLEVRARTVDGGAADVRTGPHRLVGQARGAGA
ncbi:DUF4255 domain-containing protein [Kitasatospora sp. NPDC056783]|uniref:DUF4255 domain-containing protein n=1 Tax=Kitasatospora sp. NPDC056783 TaxID=3345943 RepID=UPI003683DD7A